MKIAVIVEGPTETAFKPHLTAFLKARLADRMPRLDFVPQNGRIPKKDKLRRTVDNLLCGREPADAVIALTDVYTGTRDFQDAADAKAKMHGWVGQNNRFYPHVAQHDFEAWLLPYWDEIKRVAGSRRIAPSGPPEQVDHNQPPSHRIKEVFLAGSKGRAYSKVRDANRILQNKDLSIAAEACPELKSFLNTILTLSGGQPIP